MPPDLSPDTIRGATFRSALRGADTSEVKRFLEEVAQGVEALRQERDKLSARLGEFGDQDLKSEFESVGREVTAVLDAAREAAESMRERAGADATRWRSEAMAEVERTRKEAKNDAEALRGDAWTAGSDLLNQATVEAKRMRESAERDAITITGEAEREAHRLVSGSRRESEDLVRAATMEAEKITADAKKERDSLLDQAHREAAASQERTRALEERREELMAELEGVRAALKQMEGTLEAKREDLNLSTSRDSSVRVIPSPRSTPAEPADQPAVTWTPGETVRVIRGDSPEPTPEPDPPQSDLPPVDTVPAEELGPEPEPPQPEPPASEEAPVADIPDEATEPVVADEPEAPAREDEVGALFASLREPGQPAPTQETTEPAAPEPAETPTSGAPQIITADHYIEERDAILLPITNRALRGVKRAVTEAQNIALDGLRTDTGWKPDEASISETLRADLITLWAESHAAGHERAEALVGSKLKRPSTPSTDSPEVIVADLVADLEGEMSSAGTGQRELQSAASKVFRAWRTDEAERRVRQLSLSGFHRGLAGSLSGRQLTWVASGTPCTACRAAAAGPAASLPPVHPGCECTVAP